MTLSFGGGAGVLTIPGVASDGAAPGGLVVDGAIVAGDSSAALVPTFHQFIGQIYAHDSSGNNADTDAVLIASQATALAGNSATRAVWIQRVAALGGHDYTAPMVEVADYSGSAADLQQWTGNGVSVARLGPTGGLGLFGHPAPAAPSTLPQATITAILDANAKASVQALANCLAAIGVLTIT